MQTPEQIHNANLLVQAMRVQSTATMADVASSAISNLLNREPEQEFENFEPLDTLHLLKAQEVLKKLNAQVVLKKLTEQIR